VARLDIIPVVDLMAGRVVHARHGDRQNYEALETPYSPMAEPVAVIQGMLSVAKFRTLYVADLDALMGKEPQRQLLERLAVSFPERIFWIDLGIHGVGMRPGHIMGKRSWPVIGSESLTEQMLGGLGKARSDFILSLDFQDRLLQGPEKLLAQPECWPPKVILMNLKRVGGLDGPDFEQAARFVRDFPGHEFIAAGGVRHDEDLEVLERIGVSAALVATALHAGNIDGTVRRLVS
jgi:phosphoribosylformimino-5-aminoimidazole carboxamide ribotide isomerase